MSDGEGAKYRTRGREVMKGLVVTLRLEEGLVLGEGTGEEIHITVIQLKNQVKLTVFDPLKRKVNRYKIV